MEDEDEQKVFKNVIIKWFAVLGGLVWLIKMRFKKFS